MERPVFNPHVKFSEEASKKLDVTKEEITSTNYLTVLRTKHIYAGTANPNKVNKRRAKNKVASQSRKKNRA